MRSEDQEEELISSAYIGDLPSSGTSRGEKIAVGGSGGVMTLWEKGAWDDQDERIYLSRDADGSESLETMAVVPDELGHGKMIATGLGNGVIKFVRIGPNKVVSEAVHDETEGVVGLGFDVEGRMVSGGGQIVKVWHEALETEAADDDLAGGKHMLDSDDSDDSDDGNQRQKNADRKKRKKAKGKDRSGKQHIMAFHDMD